MRSPSKEVFLQIIATHQKIINSVCSVYFPLTEDRKDVRQDIILQLWKSLPAFRNESKISTWIYKVSLNTVLSKIRNEKKFKVEESLSEAHFNDPAMSSLADDELQQLPHILKQVGGIDKAIIVLHLEGYNHKEIASMMSLTPTNISTRMNRIITRLKKIYKTKHYEHR
jgi:RNA polymerase sigma factor (sigma-70 family)